MGDGAVELRVAYVPTLAPVSVQPTADEHDLAGLLRFLGREVRPLR